MVRFLMSSALSICAAAGLLAGCAIPYDSAQGRLAQGGSPLVPARSAVLSEAPSAESNGPRVPRGTGQVQYVSNLDSNSTLLEFDYPKGESPIGSISGYGGSECTTGARTFWVVESDQVLEFKAGGKKPIATRTVTAGEPASCAVDFTTGDLALTILPNGDVVIFKLGSKSGTILNSGLIEAYFDGYDANGNLFVDGFNSSDAVELVELPKGSSKFQKITTSNAVQFPGSVQWEGKYLTVLDQLANAIYQYTVSGTRATLKGTVLLSGSSDCAQTWISRPYFYCADAGNNDVAVYKYPAGGSRIATLTGIDAPAGVVSLRVR
jgi:hypothetical protein